jgi:hypothetical protein
MVLKADAWISGVTHSTADTVKATLIKNPIGHEKVAVVCINGEGVYVEDDGSGRPYISGITATGIDVRSTAISKAYVIGLMDISSHALFDVQDVAAT